MVETLERAIKPSDLKNPMKLKHLGIAVPDIERAIKEYEVLFGYSLLSGPFDDRQQQAKVCFVGREGGDQVVFELIAPLSAESHVNRLISKGTGAYHACFEVDDIGGALRHMRSQGCLIVADPAPAVAFDGRRIAWLFTPTKLLIELVEQ